MSDSLAVATVLPDSPRREDFIRAYGADTVPILSLEPTVYPMGDGSAGRFYVLDFNRLPVNQRERLIDYLARRFRPEYVDRESARRVLATEGMPIAAFDVSVSIVPNFASTPQIERN